MEPAHDTTTKSATPTYDDHSPLYNSRIFKVYIDYLSKNHPEINLEEVLEFAGITSYAIEDQAHWFSQTQVDRFNQIIVQKTGNPNISRDAGRYAVSSGGLAALQQYLMGFMGLSYVYLLMGKLYGIVSRGATVTAKRIRNNKVELFSRPNPGVNEKPYQCLNRIGTFESLANLFSNEMAQVDHPTCRHEGADHCHYVITWKRTASMSWRLVRNMLVAIGIPLLAIAFFYLPLSVWITAAGLTLFGTMGLSLAAVHSDNKDLSRTITEQGNAAKDLLDEINVRHANSSLVQEIGQALSKTLDITELGNTVVSTMVKRTQFDRGLIMLVNRERTRLVYQAGYGYTPMQEALIKQSRFHLDNPESKGPFVLAFKQQTPFLVEDIAKSLHKISPRSRELINKLSVKSLICAPILFEREALGILAVDNDKASVKFDESDLHLVAGIASQTGAGIANANYFRQLKESEQEYRQLVESARSIILRMDKKGDITFFNVYAQGYFGYAEQEILGQDVLTTLGVRSEVTVDTLQEMVQSLEENPQQKVVSENEHLLPDGRKTWITWTYSPILDKDDHFAEILCVGNDITELKHASQEKQALERRLQRAEKMEAIGTLAGGVAHDLNNILAGIVTYPQALMMSLPADDTRLRKALESISDAGEKAAAIVQDLLMLARRGVTKMEVVDLNEITRDFLSSIVCANLRLLHTGVTFNRSLDEQHLHISASPAHLNKVLLNLVTNAVEAMPDGGELMVSTKQCTYDENFHGYENVPPGAYAVLSVSDTGIGISAEESGRIFEPFYTKKVMARSGTGLGMAVVWGTVKDHSGFIDFESDVGQGTRFELYFPLTEQEPAVKQPFDIEEFRGAGETILVVDDVKAQRDVAFELLTRLGYTVDTAPSGRSAVDYVRENAVNLLVLDMIMDPECDGLETYRKVLEMHPGQKAIITSGFSETVRVKEAQRLGAGTYLKKPYTLEQLARAVKDVLHSKTVL